ncbi:hypothetical protein IMY05_002G0026400 [Salix suchowensis]|nr:hypothetical protein IMY05_002G0026400 [Salix suchowensis]
MVENHVKHEESQVSFLNYKATTAVACVAERVKRTRHAFKKDRVTEKRLLHPLILPSSQGNWIDSRVFLSKESAFNSHILRIYIELSSIEKRS